jgi:N-sulfoglucosamine sulfohydrolase
MADIMKPYYLKAIILISPWLFADCNRSGKGSETEKRPNILIAMGDDISFPHMGAYGTTWVKTPGFDRVAANGILFNNVYTPNAKCSPSRACFLTGRNSWQLEEGANHYPYFPSKFTTFIEALGRKGYYTGYTAKGWAPGVALDSTGKSREMTGKAFNSKILVPPTDGISNIDYASNFSDFLDSRTDKKPFCFWYGSKEPHRKYEYGSGIKKGGKHPEDIKSVPPFWPDNSTVRTDMLDYAFEIEHFDSQLVKMLEILEKRGELENTIVIVTADNGMPFPRAKGQAYEYSNHVPLAIMWGKGIKNPGRKIFDFISFIDFAPTLLEVAGLNQSEAGMKKIEGHSFTDIFKSVRQGYVGKERKQVIIGRERNDVGRPNDNGYPVRGIIMDGYLFISNYNPERWPAGNPETGYLDCDGSPTKSFILSLRRSGISADYWKICFGRRGDEELYDLTKDPVCLKNLATNAAYNTLKRKLHTVLYITLLNQNDPRAYYKGDTFDRYPYADETVRNFYTRYMNGEITRKSAAWVDSTDFEDTGF